MKINFDSLFKQESPTFINQQLFKKFLSFDPPPTNHKNSFTSSKTLDVTANTIRGSTLKDADMIRCKLQFEIKAVLESNSVQKDSVVWKKKKKIDINKMSQRMYNPPPCSKKQCKNYELQKKNKQIEEDQRIKVQNQQKKNSQKNYSNKNTVRVHQRLHHDGKIKQLKRLEKVRQNDQQRQELKKYSSQAQSSAYLQNYIPFYERLDAIVSKSQQRKKFVAENPRLSNEVTQKYYIPAQKTKKYKQITSRYSKQVSPRQNYSVQEGINDNSSLNTSFESIMSLDRSIEIVNNIEGYFFNRMKCIFLKKDSNLIDISEQNIKLLSDVEFKVMQGFIMQLEQHPLNDQQFVQKLQEYYQMLDFRDKQELRSHQAKLKKYLKLQEYINSKRHDPSDSKILIESFRQRKKNQNPNGYFQKLQKFV